MLVQHHPMTLCSFHIQGGPQPPRASSQKKQPVQAVWIPSPTCILKSTGSEGQKKTARTYKILCQLLLCSPSTKAIKCGHWKCWVTHKRNHEVRSGFWCSFPHQCGHSDQRIKRPGVEFEARSPVGRVVAWNPAEWVPLCQFKAELPPMGVWGSHDAMGSAALGMTERQCLSSLQPLPVSLSCLSLMSLCLLKSGRKNNSLETEK